MKYRLVDHGYSYRKICTGRKWVGRTYKAADGTYAGIIGKTEFKGAADHDGAFRGVVAKHLGFNSVGALHQHNAEVSAKNRATKARAQRVVDDMTRGDFSSLDKLFGI